MPVRVQIAIVVLLAVALAAGWWWVAGALRESDAGAQLVQRSGATPVIVETIDLVKDRITVRAVGTGRAIRSAAIHPPVAGEVVEVAFRAEQRVVEGQPLLKLDDKHQRLAVRLAEIDVKEAAREVARLEQLAPRGHVAQAHLQTAHASLESAEVRLAQARAALQDRTVYAPFDGIVGLTDLDKGDRVTEGTLVTTLDDRSFILVEFNLPEIHAGRIRVGDEISVRPWSLPGLNVTGIITATGSRIDRTMRTLRVQAKIPNPDDAIRPGSSFEVQLDYTGQAYPSVHEVAVLWSRDGAYLWRVVGDKAERVFVKLVRRERGRVLVDGPLQAGDRIVVEGVQGLRLGQRVRPVPYKRDEGGAAAATTAGSA